MRRPINWFVVFLSTLVLFVSHAMPGRGGSVGGQPGNDFGGDPPTARGMFGLIRDAAEIDPGLKNPGTQTLLLTLSTDAADFNLELFDNSLIEQRLSRDAITLGDTPSFSHATSDRHTFAYVADEHTDRVALPAANVTGRARENVGAELSPHPFEILGKQSASSAALYDAGLVSPPDS